MKKQAGMYVGTEAWDSLQAMLKSRVDTDAQFRNLFVRATEEMKNGDQTLMRKLLVQAPAAITQAPNLTKDLTKISAKKQKPISRKRLATVAGGALATVVGGMTGSGYLYGRRKGAQEAASIKSPALVKKLKHLVGKRYAKKMFLPAMLGGSIGVAHSSYRLHKQGLVKKSSVDAFFEENGNFMTVAQQRFPELLKVATPTQKVPNLKPMKPTTQVTGALPTQSTLSNGSP